MEGAKPLPEIVKDERRRPFLVVSYYTVNSGYQTEILNLVRTLDRWGLDYKLSGINSRGSWFNNIAWRPQFLKQTMAMLPGRSLLWLDSDARVQQDPILFDKLEGMGYDLAVHYRNDRELLGGTMWFSSGPMAARLVDIWAGFQNQNPQLREQQSLQILLPGHKEFRVYKLPATYCQIFDLMKHAGQPVIEHFQASRRFKKAMGATTPRRFF